MKTKPALSVVPTSTPAVVSGFTLGPDSGGPEQARARFGASRVAKLAIETEGKMNLIVSGIARFPPVGVPDSIFH
jgi:hypothetical protein